MPIGFANSILGTGSSATGANAFVDWDGSNDDTFTRTSAVQGFLGFAAFNDEYGVSLHITDAGGSSFDHIRYDVLRNNSGTLSIANQDQSFLTTSTSNYIDFRHKIMPTNSGNIFVDTDIGTNDAAIFSISGSSVTQHTTFKSRTDLGLGGKIYRQPSSDVYVNTGHRGAELMTLTDNGDSSSDSSGSSTFVASSQMFYNQARVIQGFKDANTMLTYRSLQSGARYVIQPFELDLTSTGEQDVVSNLVGSQVTLDLAASGSNVIEFGQGGSSHFETTDFNDMCIFIERKGGSPGQIRVHHFTTGDSTTLTSNTLTYSAGSDNDVSPTGCFVGANNDVFVFAHLQDTSNMIICKFVKSTNTLSEITRINDTFNIEKCRMSRWGDGAALLTYNDVKMRLIQI